MKIRSPKHFESKTNELGFTLIEILIAMVIFTVGILAVAGMQGTTVSNNSKSRGTTDISACATERIEELIRLPWDDADLAAGTHSVAAGNLTVASDGIDNDYNGTIDDEANMGPLSISWTVTDDQAIDNTKTVVVTVTLIRYNINKTVSITRIIPRIV